MRKTFRLKSFAFLFFIFVISALLFFSLSSFSIPGGDTKSLVKVKHSEMGWGSLRYYQFRYPLSQFLVNFCYKQTNNLMLSFEIVSSVFGGLWILTLLFLKRSFLFVAFNLLSIIFFVFTGHKEFYAPVTACLTFYFALSFYATQPDSKIKPWHCALVWGVSVICHKLALFYIFPLIFLFLDFKGRKTRFANKKEIQKVLYVIIIVVILIQLPLIGSILHWDVVARQTDNPTLELITLNKAWADDVAENSLRGAFQKFYFGELDHFKFFFGFMLLSCPIGIFVVLLNWRKLLDDRYRIFTTAIGCGLIWAFMWHPHMGWLDWDLFSTAYISVNLLAGLLLLEQFKQKQTK